MKRISQISVSSLTTTSRIGEGTFCSDFAGRNNIADTGSGFKDIIDW